METCPSNKYMSRMQVDCEGPACSIMSPATRCEKDADCSSLGGNFKCTEFGNDLSSADPIGGLLWPGKNTPVCTPGETSVCKHVDDVNLFDCDSQRCNPDLFKSELGHIFTTYQNDQPFEESSPQSVKFCTPHLDRIADDLESWSKNQYSVVGDVYTIAGMRDADITKIGFCASDGSVTVAPPPPPATVAVRGTMKLDGYTEATFGTAEKTAFKNGIAKTARVSPSSVTLTVKDARRHLLAGISIEFTIATTDANTAADIAQVREEVS